MENHDNKSIKDIMYKQVSLWLSVGAIVFGAFIYLTTPSEENDTAIQLQQQQITQQRDTIDRITKIQQNDTQEVKSELKEVRREQRELKDEVIKIQTILEERLPAN